MELRTSSGRVLVSRSGVMTTDWTRNLSLHLAPGAGSSFIGWSKTEFRNETRGVSIAFQGARRAPPHSGWSQGCRDGEGRVREAGERTLNENSLSGFDSTRVRSHAVLLWSGRLDLERYRMRIAIRHSERTLHQRRKRAWIDFAPSAFAFSLLPPPHCATHEGIQAIAPVVKSRSCFDDFRRRSLVFGTTKNKNSPSLDWEN